MANQIGFRALVRRRAKGRCEWCGCQISKRINHGKQGTIHHRMPRRIQVDNSPYNLMLLCLDCHREVHANEDYAALKGLIAYAHPARVPVLVRREGWALLTGGGGYHPLDPEEAVSIIDAAEESRGNQLVGLA